MGELIMTIRKAVTPDVIEANRRNGKFGGPKSKRGKNAVKNNAIKHGLLAKRLIFRDEEERANFDAFADQLEKEEKPQGMLQRMLTEEIAVTWWKLLIAEGWESAEILNRQEALQSTMRRLIEESGQTNFPLFRDPSDATAGRELSFDCNELIVRSSNREDSTEGELEMRAQTTGRLEFAARLTSSLDTVLRYQNGLKRELYKAIRQLKELQASEGSS
jgi:hypothetical protein